MSLEDNRLVWSRTVRSFRAYVPKIRRVPRRVEQIAGHVDAFWSLIVKVSP